MVLVFPRIADHDRIHGHAKGSRVDGGEQARPPYPQRKKQASQISLIFQIDCCDFLQCRRLRGVSSSVNVKQNPSQRTKGESHTRKNQCSVLPLSSSSAWGMRCITAVSEA